MPNRKELTSILDLERVNPAVDPVFHTGCTPGCTVTTCSCTASFNYWSSTTNASNPFNAWLVDFDYGYVYGFYKYFDLHVRAVRGGS